MEWSQKFRKSEISLDTGTISKFGVWRPHVRTWVFSEANAPYWRKYLWHCWAFSAPHAVISRPTVIRRRGITPEACAARLCSHTFSVGLILEPREGWIVIDVIPRQKNQPKGALTSKSLVSVACLVFPFSLLWPSLLTCSGHASVTATSPSLRPCPEMYLGSAEP